MQLPCRCIFRGFLFSGILASLYDALVVPFRVSRCALSKMTFSSHKNGTLYVVADDNNNDQSLEDGSVLILTGDSVLDNLRELESELVRLQFELEEQPHSYDQQMRLLEQQSLFQVQVAQNSLQTLSNEYHSYRDQIMAQLDAAPSQEHAARMEREIVELKKLTESQQTQLDVLQIQLAENRQARQALQAEILLLRERYSTRLAELEDAFELEQNDRIKEQKLAQEQLEQVQFDFRQRLQEAEWEWNQRFDNLTAVYTTQLTQSNGTLENSTFQLQAWQRKLVERQKKLTTLQRERQSVWKMLWITLNLIQQRLTETFFSTN